MAKISILGAGSWGTALAWLLHNNGHNVMVWSIMDDEVELLRKDHENKKKLPGVILPDDMTFTGDLKTACSDRDLLVTAVASPYIRSTAHSMKPFVKEGQLILNVAKGIEEHSLKTLSDIIEEEIPQAEAAVLSGPSHAEEVGKGVPTTIVAGSKKEATAKYIQELFMSPVFRVYTSPDVLGIEIGAALKNVIALAAGIADGLGYGDNTKAALITRGIAEISRLAEAMGARSETLFGLFGIGDLVVTCSSRHSRNRRAGFLIGQGRTMKQAMNEVSMVVEGVYSAKAGLELSEKYNIDMPITCAVNEVLFEDKPAADAVNDLMLRDKKVEIEVDLWEK